MNRLLLIVLLGCFSITASASHIVGGEMFYDCLGGDQYRVTVKLYRDCYSTGAQYDQNLPVTVFDKVSGAQLYNFSIPFPGSTTLPVTFSNPCVTIPPDICVEEAIYEGVFTLPASATGYTLAYQRCCRGPNVVNLLNPADEGITLTCDIPPTSQAVCNSSPRFNNFPPLLLCANQELVFDHSATDPDGDSLVYELCAPFNGGTSMNPAPNPASPPPYATVTYQSGITPQDPYGSGTIDINPNTGLLVTTPDVTGLFVVGVCVKEYRNGVLIGITRRDFLFTVFDCEITMEAIVTAQSDLSTFVTYCGGLTIDFENESYGGTNYQWDFGVPGITTDVSTAFEPTYTYPAGGTYTVTLVVNPGWTCTDTSVQTFTVQNAIDAFFEPPEPQCIDGNSYDFFGDGVFPATGTDFEWDFGPNAIPSTSTDQNPTGIEFQTAGTHDVTFTVNYDVCTTSWTEEVLVHGYPSILFSVADELKCAPYTAEFINFSSSSSPLYYDWDFGDGATSNVEHPIHVYDQPGVYDVTLTIWNDQGCIDTLTLTRPNLIEVFPKPVSEFTVDPLVQDEYHADFNFTDLSIDAVDVWYNFGDGYTGPGPDAEHFYNEPGVYLPWQIVTNAYGCQDSSKQKLTVIPVVPVFVPNAFTPDGDHVNNTFKPIWYETIPFEMWIYNRWGELVHYSNEPDAYWDGTNQSNVFVEDGVYVWRIQYLDYKTDLPVVIEGHVTVLR